MKIETLEIAGIAGALTALRLPFKKEMRSSVAFDMIQDPEPLVLKDGEQMWFTNTECHINEKDLSLMSTLVKRGDEHAKVIRGIVVYARITAPVYWWCEMETYRAGHERLSSESTMHIDCKGLSGQELQDAKSAIPMGKELTKVDMFSYQALRNMVKQRHNHRLPEWHQFVDWIKALPFAQELILAGLDDDAIHAVMEEQVLKAVDKQRNIDIKTATDWLVGLGIHMGWDTKETGDYVGILRETMEGRK